MERYPGKWNSYSTWTWGRIGSFAIFFFLPPWSNKWKNHFSAQQFHHCWAESSSDPRRPRCFGSKDEGKRGESTNTEFTRATTLKGICPETNYILWQSLCHTTHSWWAFGTQTANTVLSTTVKTQPFNNANVRKNWEKSVGPRGTRFIMYNFHGNLAICRLWPGFVWNRRVLFPSSWLSVQYSSCWL